jgi:hypothetical protein
LKTSDVVEERATGQYIPLSTCVKPFGMAETTGCPWPRSTGQRSTTGSSGDRRRNVSWNARRRSSRAGAQELPASLVHVPVSEVPQNDVASRWSWVTPTAGYVTRYSRPTNRKANFRKRDRAIHRHPQRQMRAAPGNHAFQTDPRSYDGALPADSGARFDDVHAQALRLVCRLVAG